MIEELKEKLKIKLEEKLNRKASKNELINAEKDHGLLIELLSDEVEDLNIRLLDLEKK